MPIPYHSRTLQLGSISLGGLAPVRIQSMTNTDTMDTYATVEQCKRLFDLGCEIVRITAQGIREAENLEKIKASLLQQGYALPLVADIHFQPKAAEVAAAVVEKVRINPGNYLPSGGDKDMDASLYQAQILQKIQPLLAICKQNNTLLRVGVNHGSLSERITHRYGNTPLGMAESALEFVRLIHAEGFDNLVLSMKASRVKTMIDANRLLVEKLQAEAFDYPIHLGVTEAGDGEDGRIKSAIGIGSLLIDGIGNTLRVSLTEDPEKEIPVAKAILQSCGNRVFTADYIACPSCGRTQYDIQAALQKVKEKTQHLKGLKIAVMGCVVNGPGEMSDADYGYVGAGQAKVHLYRRQACVRKNVPEAEAVEALVDLIKQEGDWVEAPLPR